ISMNKTVIKITDEEKRRTKEILDDVNLNFIDHVDTDNRLEQVRKEFNEEIRR
ncbi:24705_t:CDS:1, partial [Racocetra persica]